MSRSLFERYRTHRGSRRLQGHDYAAAGAYFVTICTHDRARLFGEIIESEVHLSAFGHLVQEEWKRSESLRPEIRLDAFVVMPNHVHSIVVIVPPEAVPHVLDPHGYQLSESEVRQESFRSVKARLDATGGVFGRPQAHSLGAMVGAFKSSVTRRINRLRGTPGAAVWQRGYHDHVIRHERAWHAIRRYIERNPARWTEDRYHV